MAKRTFGIKPEGAGIWLEIKPPRDVLDALDVISTRMGAIATKRLAQRARKFRKRALARLQRKPGAPVYPIEWESDKQEDAFFASDGFGGGIPTVRDDSYINAFEVEIVPQIDGGYAEVTNSDDGAPYIGGDLQQQFHANTGWELISDMAAELNGELEEELIGEYFLLADPLEALKG